MSSGLSVENFLQQWEDFCCAQDIQRYRQGLFTYLQKGGIPLEYSAAKDFYSTYPPTGTWVAIPSATFTDWVYYMQTYTVADTHEMVLVVLRSLGRSKLSEWVDNIAAKTTEVGKSLDDPKEMVLQGYTAGNLSKPSFCLGEESSSKIFR
ncbi:hypothetical protein BDZ91DRAFT_786269 [Kalaharituber pfeilii]|nr:hypothetical protein BDZ91DRAFT_786269 [Kalaharituber pfeilii]